MYITQYGKKFKLHLLVVCDCPEEENYDNDATQKY